jgi:prepilin peptidase CpaA
MVAVPEIALWVLLAVACATDLLWGKIYNWLTFPFLAAGLITRFGFEGYAALGQALASVAVAFALFFPLYVLKVVAAGDAKLLMAMGAWLSGAEVIRIAAIAIVIGALVGLVSLIAQKGLRGSAQSVAENVRSHEPTATALKMAFGPAFLCAYLIVDVAQLRHWEWV